MIQQSYDWLLQHPGYTAVAFHALLVALYALGRHFLERCHEDTGKRKFRDARPAHWFSKRRSAKAEPAVSDMLVLEDACSSLKKKRITVGDLMISDLARADHQHPVFYTTPTPTPTPSPTPTPTPTMTPT